MDNSYKLRSSFDCRSHRYFVIIGALFSLLFPVAIAQNATSRPSGGITIQGTVLDTSNKPVEGAFVLLEEKNNPAPITTRTTSLGTFVFSALRSGTYKLSAEKSGLRSQMVLDELSYASRKRFDLVLKSSGSANSVSIVPPASSPESMEFADKPNFMVAGITDWTAVAGHGSDSSLRTSEALARETLTLKPGNADADSRAAGSVEANETERKLREALASEPGGFNAHYRLGEYYLHRGKYQESIPLLQASYQIDPDRSDNEYDLALAYKETGNFTESRIHLRKLIAHHDNADLHRLAGELDEELADPLSAVREFEQAVRMDPSEQNYFEWGSELLFHRAVWQAQEVFAKAAVVNPKTARILTAWGAALFASGLYDQAALHVCEASDLNPADPAPYIFMGKIEKAAPTPLGCIEPKLARFVQEQPENPLANYFYALAIWKRQPPSSDHEALRPVEALLTKAVTIDPKCGDAYLQLGNLYSNQHSFEKASDYYTKALQADPQLSEAHYRLAIAYGRMGESAKAKQEFQLHNEIEKRQTAAIELQRREVKQFMVVLQEQPNDAPIH